MIRKKFLARQEADATDRDHDAKRVDAHDRDIHPFTEHDQSTGLFRHPGRSQMPRTNALRRQPYHANSLGLGRSETL
jgi:hypothetical protein